MGLIVRQVEGTGAASESRPLQGRYHPIASRP